MKTAEEIIQALKNCSKKIYDCRICQYQKTVNCCDELKRDAYKLILDLMGSKDTDEAPQDAVQDKKCWTREKVLAEAKKCVFGQRDQSYGGPEDSFQRIANLWNAYCGFDEERGKFSAVDVAAMMALLKVARISANPGHMDSWVDLAGYASCGGEIAGKESDHESK